MSDEVDRRPIPLCPPFVIDRDGRVFNAMTGRKATALRIEEAARDWNRYERPDRLTDPFLDGVATTWVGEPTAKRPPRRKVVAYPPDNAARAHLTDAKSFESGLVHNGMVRWLFLNEGRRTGTRDAVLIVPREWLDLVGDAGEGWYRLREPGGGAQLFHGPSVSAYLVSLEDDD